MQLASLAQDDLANLSIEELAQIQVRSASKRDEPLSAAAAALYVITGQEIESNVITSLPEALRLAPNLSVQQVDASQYSISARGFNGIQAGNKVLAMIDGRSIYTPLGSTVFWNQWWPLLEDIQQSLFSEAHERREANIVRGIDSIEALDAHFSADKRYPGWAEIQWSRPANEALDKVVEQLKARKLTFRNVPLDAAPADGACLFTGEPAVERIYVARAY